MIIRIKNTQKTLYFSKFSFKKLYSTTRKSNFEYCTELVKTNHYNAYIETILLPQNIMRASFAVKSFNIELQSIGKSQIKDNRVAQGKIVFWKEQIDKIFNSIKEIQLDQNDQQNKKQLKFFEPVSNELAHAIRAHNLSKIWFTRMIEGRKHFFSVNQFKNIEELEKCADASMSSIYYILFNCMNIKNVDCDHAASHLGKAQMITAVVKNLLRRPSQSVYYIPGDLLLKHKIAQQDLINSSERILRSKQKNLKDLVFELCTRAKQHINSSHDLKSKIPKESRVILAPSIGLNVFLDKMEKHDFDLMNPKLNKDFKTQILTKLMLARLTNKY
jgi:NADH dehydrogenase [ubiquinone] 1 alpha subcomplex assembly factor 6